MHGRAILIALALVFAAPSADASRFKVKARARSVATGIVTKMGVARQRLDNRLHGVLVRHRAAKTKRADKRQTRDQARATLSTARANAREVARATGEQRHPRMQRVRSAFRARNLYRLNYGVAAVSTSLGVAALVGGDTAGAGELFSSACRNIVMGYFLKRWFAPEPGR